MYPYYGNVLESVTPEYIAFQYRVRRWFDVCILPNEEQAQFKITPMSIGML
jgi:hypothetical protein